jgi:hypothetical protein
LSLVGPNILFSTLLSNTLSLRSSLHVGDEVSYHYKTGKITVQFLPLSLYRAFLPNPVKNNQQVLKEIFIVLIELPRNVSASKYHLQGVTLSL